MDLTDGCELLPDIEIHRCASLEKSYKENASPEEGTLVEENEKKLNIFMLDRMKPNPLVLFHNERLRLDPLDCLYFLANSRDISVIEVQKCLNMFIERVLQVQVAFILFPFRTTRRMFAYIISDLKLEDIFATSVTDSIMNDTFQKATADGQSFFSTGVSEQFLSAIIQLTKLEIKGLLGVPFNHSSFKKKSEKMVLCLLNKEAHRGEKYKALLDVNEAKKLANKRIHYTKFNRGDIFLVKELLGYLGPIILACSSCHDPVYKERFNNLMNISFLLLDYYNDLDGYFKVLMCSTILLFNASMSMLLLADKSKSFLIGNIYRVLDDMQIVQGIKIPSNHGLLGQVYHNAEYISTDDTKDHPSYCKKIDEMTGFSTHNSITCPIIFNGRVYGVIDVRNNPESFAPEDEDMLKVIVTLCLIGLHRSVAK